MLSLCVYLRVVLFMLLCVWLVVWLVGVRCFCCFALALWVVLTLVCWFALVMICFEFSFILLVWCVSWFGCS